MNPPEDIAVDYLKSEDNGQILTMLERLDIEVGNSNNVFANLWQAFVKVRAHLYKKVYHNADWGNNVASMIFAAEAFCKISFDKKAQAFWDKQAMEIRNRWIPNDNNDGLAYIGHDSTVVNGTLYNMSSEIIDFAESIKKCMQKEEQSTVYTPQLYSDAIDYYRFHDNWLLGLLLGFEGLATDSCSKTLRERYVECAKNMQLDSGAFYPERVPWVTARVIMGLAQCGLTYYSSDVVKQACDWLVEQITDDIDTMGFDFPYVGWKSGTGTWNSDIQITLMNLEALHRAQYPSHLNGAISATLDYVVRYAEELAENALNPLDIVWILDVMKSRKENLVHMSSMINKLLAETMKIWGEANLDAYVTQRESSDVSFLAKELLDIMWSIVSDNLPNLLSGLERESIAPNNEKQIFISYRRTEGEGSPLAETIYKYLNSVYRNNVFFDKYDLYGKTGNYEDLLGAAIQKSKVVVLIVGKGVFDRCLEEGYDIDKDVYISEIKQAFKQQKDMVVVYYDSIELPEKLKQNPVCYDLAEKISKQQAVFYHSAERDAGERLGEDIKITIDKILVKGEN